MRSSGKDNHGDRINQRGASRRTKARTNGRREEELGLEVVRIVDQVALGDTARQPRNVKQV